MTDLIVWTVILVIVDVLYLIYERYELNPNNASNYEDATEMIKERNKNRTFFIGLNIFVLGIWIKGTQEVTGLLFMTIGAIIAFFGK
jgi:hypothetical protein